MNMLTSKELKLLLLIMDGEKTITTLSKEMNLSIYRTSTLTGKLAKKGLITITKNGKYKIISLSSTKPAILLKKVKNKYNHIPLQKILTGNNLKLLSILKPELLQNTKTLMLKTNLSKSSLYHAINNLSNYGIIKKVSSNYSLIEKYALFHEFSREYIILQNHIKGREFSPDAAIIWNGVEEFILSTKTYKTGDNFQLTGLSKFKDYGLSLIGKGIYYYYYSKKKDKLTIEDIIIHSIVIDYAPRTILYVIVLLLFHKNKIDEKKVFDLDIKYNVNVKQLLDYLNGKEHKYPYPSLKEVYEIYNMYFGVSDDKWQ